jgi:hypothetical protein
VACSDDVELFTGPANQPPVISALDAEPDTFVAAHFVTITVTASDPDGDNLTYEWNPNASWLMPVSSTGNSIDLTNCCHIDAMQTAFVHSIVSDGRGGQDRDSIQIWVLPAGGR